MASVVLPSYQTSEGVYASHPDLWERCWTRSQVPWVVTLDVVLIHETVTLYVTGVHTETVKLHVSGYSKHKSNCCGDF